LLRIQSPPLAPTGAGVPVLKNFLHKKSFGGISCVYKFQRFITATKNVIKYTTGAVVPSLINFFCRRTASQLIKYLAHPNNAFAISVGANGITEIKTNFTAGSISSQKIFMIDNKRFFLWGLVALLIAIIIIVGFMMLVGFGRS
jgi:hypothetical protein